jgi:hypothetical protein
LIVCIDPPSWGHVAEWLRSGLQSRLVPQHFQGARVVEVGLLLPLRHYMPKPCSAAKLLWFGTCSPAPPILQRKFAEAAFEKCSDKWSKAAEAGGEPKKTA